MSVITKFKNNNNFHTAIINCVFQFKCDKSEVMAYTILTKLLSKTNKKYPEVDLFAREKLNRYIMNMSVSNQSINDIYFINCSLLLPSDGVVSDYNELEAVEFLLDSIYEVNLDNMELFEREKRLYLEGLLNNYKNIEFIAEKNMLDLLDDDCKFNKIKYKDLENIKNLTVDDVINFYNKYIRNIKPKIFIYGSVNKEKIECFINEYFDRYKLKNYKIIKDYNSFYNNEKIIDETVRSKYYQSIVYMVYNVNDYKESDFYKLYMINLLLNNPASDLLYYNLRKKNSLVYACGSSLMIRNGLLIIKAITNKNSVKVSKLVIEKVLKDLKNIELYKDNILRIIERLEYNLIRDKDNFFKEPTNIINEYFKSDNSSEKELVILKSLSVNDILDCINRLELKCIYTLEGIE